MKTLMISTDRKIFEENSVVRQRVVEYGKLVEELKIIIFSSSTRVLGSKYQVVSISNSNITLYPTNSKNRWFYIFDAIRLGLKMKLNKDWLVTTQDPFETGLVGWLITRKSDAKLQLQVHTDFLSKYFRKESFLNRIRVELAKFLIPKADRIRVVSGRIKRSIIGHGLIKNESKIQVLPIFVDLEKIKNTQLQFDSRSRYPQFDFVFLITSRLEKEKNIKMLIEAFAEVVKKHPKVGLVILGEGSVRKSLQFTVDDLQLSDEIVFEGWQDSLVSYYKTADLFLLSSNYEGFGMTLVEATSLGCPILTTNVGLVGEILTEENSLVCNVGDKDCFAQKMLWAIENKSKLKELNQKAQTEIENKLIKTKKEYLREYKKSWGK